MGYIPVNSGDDQIRFECTTCGACCRDDSLLVTVTGRDVVRISRGLNLGPTEVIRALDFYLVSSHKPPEGLRDFPAVNTERGLAYIALKKLENGDCVFLKDNLCMIHLIRPAVCVSFPFVFRKDNDENTWGLSARKEICPGLGNGPVVVLSDLNELAVMVLEDISVYQTFVERWNDEEKTPTVKGLIAAILSDPIFSV